MGTNANVLSDMHNFSTYNREVFRYTFKLLESIGCPPEASASYEKYLVTRLCNEGFPFVKKLKNLFVLGLKTLGADPTLHRLSDFSYKKGKPKLFRFVFTTLEEQSSLGAKFDPVIVKTCLSVLSIGKMIYTVPDFGTRDKAVLDAISDLTQPVACEPNEIESTVRKYLKNKVPRFDPRPPSPARMSGKKGKGSWRFLPFPIVRYWQSLQKDPEKFLQVRLSCYHNMKPESTVGKFSCLVEHGAKLRVISVFNPWMNSTSLWEDLRGYLNTIKQDVSKDQSEARPYLEKLTSKFVSRCAVNGPKLRHSFVERPQTKGFFTKLKRIFSRKPETDPIDSEYHKAYMAAEYIVSADLTAATDKLSSRSVLDFVYDIGYGAIYPVITAKVVYPKSVYNPVEQDIVLTKPPMGLGGCFEIFSCIHHALVQLYCTCDYLMCGDDLVGIFDLKAYEKASQGLGLVLNQSKTLLSRHTAQFCGMVYHHGIDVSPIRLPKVLNSGNSEQRRRSTVEFYERCAELKPCVRKYAKRYIYRRVLPLFHGQPVSLLLPNKLGGFGLKRSQNVGLQQVLEMRKQFLIANSYVREIDEERESISRVPIPELREESDLFRHTLSLYKDSGLAVKVPRRFHRPVKYMPHKGRELCQVWEVLDYYYGQPS